MTDRNVVPPADDQGYEEYSIQEVYDFSERHGYYCVVLTKEIGLVVALQYGDNLPHGIEPKVGDTMRVYWTTDQPLSRRQRRGILINGKTLFYQSSEESKQKPVKVSKYARNKLN